MMDGPDLEGEFNFWFADVSAIEKIYWLSREPNALEDLWSATWSMLFSSACCECCGGQLCHGLHPVTDGHASIRVYIMIKSNKMVQLPMQWLYSKFLGVAKTTLVKALGTRFNQFTIGLYVHRPGKLEKQAWKTSLLANPFDSYTSYSEVVDMNFVALNSGHVDAADWYERTKRVERIGLYLPTNRQVLTVTGPWYKSTEPAEFGNVFGDCKFKPIEDREFNDRWEYGWEYDERNYTQHHELVHKAGDAEYERVKAKRSKPRRASKGIAACWRNKTQGTLASGIANDLKEYYEGDLKEYYEECNGWKSSGGDSDSYDCVDNDCGDSDSVGCVESDCGDSDFSDCVEFTDPFEHKRYGRDSMGSEFDLSQPILEPPFWVSSFDEIKWPPLPGQGPSPDPDAFLSDMLQLYELEAMNDDQGS